MSEKLAIIDGNSIFYREFYALPTTLKNREGQPTNAIYGFANAIIKVINDLKPTHMVVAFDVSRKTFRNEIFADYKATRKPMPDELRAQVEPLRDMLKTMNILYLEKEGLEGDDIVGTIAKRFSDTKAFIITGDRDCYQLVDNNTKIYVTKKGVSDLMIVGEPEIQEMFGLKPSQLIDLKALQGDKSDNIPGASGVGEKTALSLMHKYGSIENLYKNIDEITGKLGENLKKDRDLVFVSKKLATIDTSVDIDCKLEDCLYDFPFGSEAYKFFANNGFRTIVNREELFDLTAIEKNDQPKAKVVEVEKVSELSQIAKSIQKNKNFSFYYEDEVCNISDGKSEFVIRLDKGFLSEISASVFWDVFKPIFEDDKIEKILFDSKTVMHELAAVGVVLGGKYFDCMIAKYVQDGNSVSDFKELFVALDKNPETIAYSLFESHKVLKAGFANPKNKSLFYDIELPLTRVLFDMEVAGFKVDVKKLDELREKYTAELEVLVKKIHALAGREFNVNSPKQLGEILFDELKLAKSKKKSTNIEALESIEDRHPIVPLIIRCRKVSKFLSTYINGLIPHLDKDNFIHTTFKQALTTTGRLSSTKPNLQNIPIRSGESREIRSIFTASAPDRVLVDADYSQIELRLLAHLSDDEKLLNAYKNNEDIHNQTACTIFGVSPEEVTPEMRRTAKIVNFGVNYGISDFGLATDLKIFPKQAKKYIDDYFAAHPKVAEYMQKQIEIARETGEITTMFGRVRKMTDINSSNYLVRSRAERASQNMPLQGSAADIIKIAMLRVDNRLKKEGWDAKLIMQVHDELIVDCSKSDADKIRELVDEEMENSAKLKVPLIAETEVSYRWS